MVSLKKKGATKNPTSRWFNPWPNFIPPKNTPILGFQKCLLHFWVCRFRLPPFTLDTRQHMIRKEIPSLKLRASSPLEMDGWNTIFLLGRPIFRGYVSFREGNLLEKLLAKNCICSPFVWDGEWKVSAPELKGYISVTNPRIGDRLESLGLHPRKIHILKPQTINHVLKAYRWIYACRFLAPHFFQKKSSWVLQLHPNQDKQTCIP